jgi:hypothetical protein
MGMIRAVGTKRSPRTARSRWARYGAPALAAAALSLSVVGGFVALWLVPEGTSPQAADGRVATSFGALWVDSYREVVVPKIIHMGHVGVPDDQSGPEQVALEVTVRLANTTSAPVELTPARFALRLGSGTPIPVEAATFNSVGLLPGAVYEARMQFPVQGGEHRLSLLFDNPDGSGPVTIDLGPARFPYPAADTHDGQDPDRHDP